SMALAIAVMLLVSAVAAYLPARYASRVDPMVAVRPEGAGVRRFVPQAPQCLQISEIERVRDETVRRGGAWRLFRLDEDRQPVEPMVEHQASKRRRSKAALADVLVPIDPARARFLRIVAMQDLQTIEADQSFEGGKRLLVASVGDDVVA